MSRPPARVVYEQPKRASVDMRYSLDVYDDRGNWVEQRGQLADLDRPRLEPSSWIRLSQAALAMGADSTSTTPRTLVAYPDPARRGLSRHPQTHNHPLGRDRRGRDQTGGFSATSR